MRNVFGEENPRAYFLLGCLPNYRVMTKNHTYICWVTLDIFFLAGKAKTRQAPLNRSQQKNIAKHTQLSKIYVCRSYTWNVHTIQYADVCSIVQMTFTQFWTGRPKDIFDLFYGFQWFSGFDAQTTAFPFVSFFPMASEIVCICYCQGHEASKFDHQSI